MAGDTAVSSAATSTARVLNDLRYNPTSATTAMPARADTSHSWISVTSCRVRDEVSQAKGSER